MVGDIFAFVAVVDLTERRIPHKQLMTADHSQPVQSRFYRVFKQYKKKEMCAFYKNPQTQHKPEDLDLHI